MTQVLEHKEQIPKTVFSLLGACSMAKLAMLHFLHTYSMIVHLYTLCWNEMAALPFVVDYWKRFVTHAWVYDNGSDDGSVEYLKQFDWITVDSFATEGMNDTVHMNMKNNVWKASRGRADYVYVCDMDEMLYAQDIECQLKYMKDNGYTMARLKWYDFISESMPVYEEGKLLHETCKRAIYNVQGKPGMLFDPNKIEETNFAPGSHSCVPVGDVKWYDGDIYVLHLNHHLGLEHYLARYKAMNARQSEENKRRHFSIHYKFPEEKLVSDYRADLARSVDFNAVVSKL